MKPGKQGAPHANRGGWRTAILALLVFAVAAPAFPAEHPDMRQPPRQIVRLLRRVNREVNEAHEPLKPWEDSRDGIFDCENYAEEKREKLAQAGIAWPDMKMWAATIQTGERHAVLVVYVDGQPFVLDNLHAGPKRWDELGYTDWAPMWLIRDAATAPAHP